MHAAHALSADAHVPKALSGALRSISRMDGARADRDSVKAIAHRDGNGEIGHGLLRKMPANCMINLIRGMRLLDVGERLGPRERVALLFRVVLRLMRRVEHKETSLRLAAR